MHLLTYLLITDIGRWWKLPAGQTLNATCEVLVRKHVGNLLLNLARELLIQNLHQQTVRR